MSRRVVLWFLTVTPLLFTTMRIKLLEGPSLTCLVREGLGSSCVACVMHRSVLVAHCHEPSALISSPTRSVPFFSRKALLFLILNLFFFFLFCFWHPCCLPSRQKKKKVHSVFPLLSDRLQPSVPFLLSSVRLLVSFGRHNPAWWKALTHV